MNVMYSAARTCYSKDTPQRIYSDSKKDSSKKDILLKSVIEMGHHSILEHVNMTFALSGISRACSHQLVRHRICSFSQQSQRYVDLSESFDYVLPKTISENPEDQAAYDFFMEDIKLFYNKLISRGIPPEDARYILPAACHTNITMTVNARELIEMCSIRLCSRAQWEIRDMFLLIKSCIKSNKDLEFIAQYLKPKCMWNGFCHEGKKSCGKIKEGKSNV